MGRMFARARRENSLNTPDDAEPIFDLGREELAENAA